MIKSLLSFPQVLGLSLPNFEHCAFLTIGLMITLCLRFAMGEAIVRRWADGESLAVVRMRCRIFSLNPWIKFYLTLADRTGRKSEAVLWVTTYFYRDQVRVQWQDIKHDAHVKGPRS